MDHGLETHVHLAATDNLSHIGRVVGLEDGDLDAFLVEVALGLSEIQGDMVRRRLPFQRVLLATDLERPDQAKTVLPWSRTQTKKYKAVEPYQLVRKVILSVAMVTVQINENIFCFWMVSQNTRELTLPSLPASSV